MNPGATTRPAASMVRVAAAPAYLPTPTILPSCTATSARRSYWIPGSYAPPWSEKRTSVCKAIEKEGLQGGTDDNNGVGRHRHIHDPGIQQEPRPVLSQRTQDALVVVVVLVVAGLADIVLVVFT